MFETPETAREYVRAHATAAAPRADALVALGLAMLRAAPPNRAPGQQALLGADAGAQAPAQPSQLALVRAELRAGRQQRTFARGAPIA